MAYKPKCDSAGCDGWGAVSLLLVVFGLLIATSQPLLGRGTEQPLPPPLLQCFEEEYRANVTLAASLLLIVSFLPPSHVSPKDRFVTCELRKPLLSC